MILLLQINQNNKDNHIFFIQDPSIVLKLPPKRAMNKIYFYLGCVL